MVKGVSIETAASIFRVELVVRFRGCELTRLYSVGEGLMDVHGRLEKDTDSGGSEVLGTRLFSVGEGLMDVHGRLEKDTDSGGSEVLDTRFYSVGEGLMNVYGRLEKDTNSGGSEVLEKNYGHVTFLRKIPHRLTSERNRDFARTKNSTQIDLRKNSRLRDDKKFHTD